MEQWEALVTTVNTILALLGMIACIAGGATAIAKLLSPFTKLKKELDAHEQKLSKNEEENKELRESIEMVAEADKILCKVLLEMLDHEITGNHVDRLKMVRGELEEFIINNHF